MRGMHVKSQAPFSILATQSRWMIQKTENGIDPSLAGFIEIPLVNKLEGWLKNDETLN